MTPAEMIKHAYMHVLSLHVDQSNPAVKSRQGSWNSYTPLPGSLTPPAGLKLPYR